MGRLANLVDAVEAASKKLDMSHAARMQRAREQGFDVDNPVYHGSAEEIKEFDAGWSEMTTGNNPHGGFFFADNPTVADDYSRQAFIRRYQDNADQLVDDGVVDALPFDADDLDKAYPFVEELAEKQIKNHPSYVRMQNPYTVDWEGQRIDLEKADAIGAFVKNGFDESGLIDMDDVYDLMKFDPDDVADNMDEIRRYADENWGNAFADMGDSDQKAVIWEAMQELGYDPDMPKFDGILHKNVIDDISEQSALMHDQYVTFDPSNIRSVNAAFDPAKKDSANLLAQAVPAGIGLGLLGMTPEAAQADTGLSQRADAPDNPFLHTLGMGVGRFNRNLNRKGLGLLSLDGLEDYLMKGAYSPEDLNYGDRLKAALDVAP